jgi:hypothetical protein
MPFPPADATQMHKNFKCSLMEYSAFLFHKLNKNQGQNLDRLKYRALRGAPGYSNGTPTNIILAESNELLMHLRFRYLGRNYLTKCFVTNNHPRIQILRDLNKVMEDPGNSMGQHISLIIECYRDLEFVDHLLEKGSVPLCYNYLYDGMMYKAKVSIEEGVDIKNSLDCKGEFPCRFDDALKTSTCFTKDGSKREGKSFTGYALLDIKQDASEKHRTLNIAYIFTAERLAIAETLKRIQKYESSRSIVFSDLKSWIQVLEGTPKLTMNHILHGI